jgi:phage terminase large subunit-like protein
MTNLISLEATALAELSYHDLIANGFTDDDIIEIISELPDDEAYAIYYDSNFWARPAQKTPPWDWRVWVLKGGRGSGKTWTGSNWLSNKAKRHERLALIGRTAADIRDTMVEGESGILAVSPPHFMPEYQPAKRRVVWPNGSFAICYTADEPNLLRGGQFEAAWADEVAAWRRIKEAWDNLQFCMRIGSNPQTVVTTTPRPIREFKEVLALKTTHVTTESTLSNVHNLAPQWADQVISIYQGSRLGRQEIYGEVLDDNPNALWTRESIDDNRLEPKTTIPGLDRIVIGVDPPSADITQGDPDRTTAECGIVVAGRVGLKSSVKSHGYILEDLSMSHVMPHEWGAQVARAFWKYNANAVIAEGNNGGAMVKFAIQAADPRIPVEIVTASRGKRTRAEPVSLLYNNKRVHHVQNFSELEDQMCEWEPGMPSPDRMDAMVWAMTDLMASELLKQIKFGTAVGGRKGALPSGLPDRPQGYGILNGR